MADGSMMNGHLQEVDDDDDDEVSKMLKFWPAASSGRAT